ncbi:hypothetical protein AMELA_G00028610 [Ameiurus melas]|uniref:Uncharacterized protein n=1 Tax=Ameiurus melas TaxID=219545 RepID=A0A7J6BD21_AMEME|nr:hypothetical protein AMELA_G00028610 [Ameiurus melas]
MVVYSRRRWREDRSISHRALSLESSWRKREGDDTEVTPVRKPTVSSANRGTFDRRTGVHWVCVGVCQASVLLVWECVMDSCSGEQPCDGLAPCPGCTPPCARCFLG